MLFNSFEFILFLPVVFLLYWFVFKRLKCQILFLVVASYLFYGWWDWCFLLLIAFTTLCSYISGLLIVYKVYMDCPYHSDFSKYNFELFHLPVYAGKLQSLFQSQSDILCDSLGWGKNYSL